MDISIGVVLDKIIISLVNPDLIKEFHSANLVNSYPKFDMLVAGTKAVFGEGLAFSEGEEWKNKRKLLSKIFNFELIKENIPKINEICDRCYDLYDSKSQTE